MNNINTPLYIIAFLFTLTLTVFLVRPLIPFLKSRARQPIYNDGPSWHLKKSGTPTMGGLSFLFSVSLALAFTSLYKYISGEKRDAISLTICTIYALLNGAVGIIDDLTKLRRKENAGLTPKGKLLLQLVLSIAFLISRNQFLGKNTSLIFSFGMLDLGQLYYFLSLIILIGITNCANLTDGIDGLASSVAFAIGIGSYLSYRGSDNASFVSLTLAAGALGFLIFNIHPAKIFMGDTGSLFLGALVAALAFEIGNPMIAIASGGVYVLEGVSVILQVIFYKITKKRLFKMAPIHHHLEKCGWDENKICIASIILTLLLSAAGTLFFIK
jgi:phospho-N-acetylmuramoyl-pentapeptide-transferase